jgi:hypothetical protein
MPSRDTRERKYKNWKPLREEHKKINKHKVVKNKAKVLKMYY